MPLDFIRLKVRIFVNFRFFENSRVSSFYPVLEIDIILKESTFEKTDGNRQEKILNKRFKSLEFITHFYISFSFYFLICIDFYNK